MSILRRVAVRADGEAVRLVAEALDEVEHRVARRQHERLAAGHVEGLAAGVAVRPLGDADERQVGDAEFGEHCRRGRELALAAVDEHEVGPRRRRRSSSPSPAAPSRGPASLRRRAKRRPSTSRIMA